MKIVSKIALLVCLLSFVACASTGQKQATDQQQATNQKYMDFFKQYESLGHAFDPTVADMYSDEATIHTIRKTPDGVEQTLKMDGSKWKELIISTMEISQKRGDKNEFSNIAVAMDGDVAKIMASRYSTIKCFTDDRYYMRVKKQSDGVLRIIEEFSETPLESSCRTTKKDDLELFLKHVVKVANKQYPIMVDADTKLEKTSSEGKTLTYHYTLVNYTADELNAQIFEQNMMPDLLKHTCADSSLRNVVDKGGMIVFQYNGKDQNGVSSMNIKESDCLRLSDQT
jgi:hypothetical protein